MVKSRTEFSNSCFDGGKTERLFLSGAFAIPIEVGSESYEAPTFSFEFSLENFQNIKVLLVQENQKNQPSKGRFVPWCGPWKRCVSFSTCMPFEVGMYRQNLS